jgi:hypothetical protein
MNVVFDLFCQPFDRFIGSESFTALLLVIHVLLFKFDFKAPDGFLIISGFCL